MSEPERFGSYALLTRLAEGGMGSVWIAKKDGASSVCVLKLLHADMAAREIAAKRFYREAHIASFLNHENVASVLDAGFEDDVFYLTMDFIGGQDVEAIHHRARQLSRSLPAKTAVYITQLVLRGLEHAHDLKDPSGKPLDLVHRDLSPRNVMVGYDGHVQIIDFGLVRSRTDDFKTAPGVFLGTMRYSSPEQALATPADRRSDLYTWSVVLWELLSGQPAVPPGDIMETLMHVARESVPPISRFRDDLPDALVEAVSRGLAKDRDDRWPNAQMYREALQAALPIDAEAERAALGQLVSEMFPDEVRWANAVLEMVSGDVGETTNAAGLSTEEGLVVPKTMVRLLDAAEPTRTQAADDVPTVARDPQHHLQTAIVERQTQIHDPTRLVATRVAAPPPADEARRWILPVLVVMVALAVAAVVIVRSSPSSETVTVQTIERSAPGAKGKSAELQAAPPTSPKPTTAEAEPTPTRPPQPKRRPAAAPSAPAASPGPKAPAPPTEKPKTVASRYPAVDRAIAKFRKTGDDDDYADAVDALQDAGDTLKTGKARFDAQFTRAETLMGGGERAERLKRLNALRRILRKAE